MIIPRIDKVCQPWDWPCFRLVGWQVSAAERRTHSYESTKHRGSEALTKGALSWGLQAEISSYLISHFFNWTEFFISDNALILGD
jgi:hypothetical protein